MIIILIEIYDERIVAKYCSFWMKMKGNRDRDRLHDVSKGGRKRVKRPVCRLECLDKVYRKQ